MRRFYAFFFLSGFCSLVYEIVWLRLCMARFGVNAPVVSLVLSVFMGGLGLGSWASGKLIGSSSARRSLRLYAAAELVIGISGVAVPRILDFGYGLIRDSASGLTWDSAYYYLVSGAWILLALLPWCTCMGATFPLVMAAIRASGNYDSQHSFSFLYAANVLGAVMGALVPAFVLIELLGLHGTLLVASCINGILALMVFIVSLKSPRVSAAKSAATEQKPAVISRQESGTLALLFLTGLCSMAMEVIWIRQFTIYLGNVVYAFATILAIYLAATFFGSTAYRRKARGRSEPLPWLAWVFLGFSALLPLILADPRFPDPDIRNAALRFLYGAVRALSIVPFSFITGFITPMLVDRWSRGDPDRAGYAYSMNVLGSIIGPLLSSFVILPWLSERWALALLAAPLFVAANGQTMQQSNRRRFVLATSLALSVCTVAFVRDFETRFVDRRELRDYTATVIATGRGMDRRLFVNGLGMTVLTPVTKMMAHMPLALLHRPPSRALVICFGMGTTFRSMLTWGISTTAVELVPSVPKMIGYYQPDGDRLLHSPRAHVVIDDGRRYLARASEKFDVITIDPPPPIEAPGSSLLYSEQFYSLIRPHLTDDGVLQIWFPGGDKTTLAAVARALRDSFPHVRAFQSVEAWGYHFFGSFRPLQLTTGMDLAKMLPAQAQADMTEWNPGLTPAQMFDLVLSRELSIDSLIAAEPLTPPITDERPVNEYFVLRSAGLYHF